MWFLAEGCRFTGANASGPALCHVFRPAGVIFGTFVAAAFGLKSTPVERSMFVPGGIVTNEKISLALKLDVLIGLIEKGLKHLGVRMRQNQCIEFSCAETDDSRDVHPNVGTLIWLADLFPFLGPSPSWARISFDTRLVETPDLHLRIFPIGLELFNKSLSLFLALFIGPGLGNFQAKSFFMEPAQQRAIPNVVLKLLCHISMKFLGGPMNLIGFIRMLDQFSIFVGFLGLIFPGRPVPGRSRSPSMLRSLNQVTHRDSVRRERLYNAATWS